MMNPIEAENKLRDRAYYFLLAILFLVIPFSF